VAIFHRSKDGEWLYVQAPYVRGWVKAKSIAIFSDRDSVEKMVKRKQFLVVTGESVSIFSDAARTKVNQRASTGTILPLAEKNESSYIVYMPTRKSDGTVSIGRGYVSLKSDVREQFPAFTQRNIIRQAFKLMGQRYGWGGMYNGRDCSGFTHDVFLSMGVDMPRDSNDQGMLGTQLGFFEPYEDESGKLKALESATEAITLLRMPHHMMLYIGRVGEEFYVIHSTWAERISKDSDTKNRINQVVVSDLTLNGKSYVGSLFDRIVSMNEVN
jgi:hypothetical protein